MFLAPGHHSPPNPWGILGWEIRRRYQPHGSHPWIGGEKTTYIWDGQKKNLETGWCQIQNPPGHGCEWDGLWHWICHNWKCNFKIFKDMRIISHILASDESNASNPLEPLWFEHISGILVDWIALNPNKQYVRAWQYIQGKWMESAKTMPLGHIEACREASSSGHLSIHIYPAVVI